MVRVALIEIRADFAPQIKKISNIQEIFEGIAVNGKKRFQNKCFLEHDFFFIKHQAVAFMVYKNGKSMSCNIRVFHVNKASM